MPANGFLLCSLSPLCFLSVCICLPSPSVFLHTLVPPSLPLISVSPSPHVCSSSLEENLTVGCNAGCSCVRELYNPVCGADGVMYYSPCHAGCNSINHTDRSTGKQVQYTHNSCYLEVWALNSKQEHWRKKAKGCKPVNTGDSIS